MTPEPTRRPGQDGNRRLVFPPLPAARLGRSFADTWWGNAWVRALEGPSRSATGRLARGRTYARSGNVGEITVTPGRATARIQGSRPTPYRTSMSIPTLTPSAWDALLDAVAAQAGHIAALLDRDMPTALADDAAQAGARLLPSPREMQADCSCPDWGDPCKHAAALYYQVARLLDTDPFVLFLLRGRSESELMAELHRRNADHDATAPAAPPTAATGTPAREAFAAARTGLPLLPAPPSPVDEPGQIAQLRPASEPVPGLDPAALEFLASDTAARAVYLLRQALLPAGDQAQPIGPVTLDVADDLVRLAAARPPDGIFTRLAFGGRRTPASLTRSARAWQYGGLAALAVLDKSWTADPQLMGAVRERLRSAWDGVGAPRIRVSGSWLTVLGHDAQLRLGTDRHLWYPYRRKHGDWWPAGFPHPDPATVLDELLS
ncbi:SWIM zinc finger family protein [Kitasatospora sp. NPDC058046]|uniref:SWIM zinc finger family protein n=1 Tax=Kitasatospora sp. NPDC058046 TaxID=3346312 RepID=UPI0036DF6BAE